MMPSVHTSEMSFKRTMLFDAERANRKKREDTLRVSALTLSFSGSLKLYVLILHY